MSYRIPPLRHEACDGVAVAAELFGQFVGRAEWLLVAYVMVESEADVLSVELMIEVEEVCLDGSVGVVVGGVETYVEHAVECAVGCVGLDGIYSVVGQ